MTATAVCLDAAGTLFVEREPRPRIYAAALARHGAAVDEATLARWMGEVHDELPEILEGQPRYSDAWFRAFLARLLARAESSADPERVRQELADVFTRPETYLVYGDVFDALEDLASRGVRLAVVSNWSARLPALLDALRLRPFFQALAVSAAVGWAKPHPSIFLAALTLLGVEPAGALHVGDHPDKDLAGARAAGLSALLLDREARAPRRNDVIGSLAEVAGRLR